MEQYLQVGVISSTHGIRGEVKVFPTTDDPTRFKQLKSVLMDTGNAHVELKIQGVKFFKKFVILKFQGIDNINEVEQYKGAPLLIERKDALPLQEDEYFIADMIGMKVFTEDAKEFGILKEVLETGANDVYVITSIDHGEVLLPAIHKCVHSIDVEARKMVISLMEGLL